MNEATVDPSHLLIQLEGILESDPHIDEVGFIHPTQFAAFSEEVHSSPFSSTGADGSLLEEDISKSESARDSNSDTCFWHNEHKLGISTLVLVQLYRAAKDAFMDSYRRYRMLSNSQVKKDARLDDNASMSFLDIAEIEVMRHSKALLLLSCDFGTAWNSRYILAPLFWHMLTYDHLAAKTCTSDGYCSFTPNIFQTFSKQVEALNMIFRRGKRNSGP